jgi:hypothetical protein
LGSPKTKHIKKDIYDIVKLFDMTDANLKYSNEIPIWKFVFLSFVTFGIYDLCWMYKQWKFFKVKDDLKIRPLWRAIFGPIFIFNLFDRIEKFTSEHGATTKYPYAVLALLWVVANTLVVELPDPYWLISMLSFVAFIQPVKAMNLYWNKTQQGLPYELVSWWEALLIILVVIFSTL